MLQFLAHFMPERRFGHRQYLHYSVTIIDNGKNFVHEFFGCRCRIVKRKLNPFLNEIIAFPARKGAAKSVFIQAGASCHYHPMYLFRILKYVTTGNMSAQKITKQGKTLQIHINKHKTE